MKRELVARLRVPRIDDKTRTGTAYPLGDGLLITASHVLDFRERDDNAEIQIEWPQLGSDCFIKVKTKELDYESFADYDIALLRCDFPNMVKQKNHTSVYDVAKQEAEPETKWKTLGYPKINQFELDEGTGKFGVEGSESIRLTLSSGIDKKYAAQEQIEGGWGGMSGAPIFNIETGKLQAIITNHIKWRNKQLEGASLAWILANDQTFAMALGLTFCTNQNQQFFQSRCKSFLKEIETSPLHDVFIDLFGDSVNDKNLFTTLIDELDKSPIACLKKIRLAIASVIKKQPNEKENARRLFFLVLGFYASGKLSTSVGNLHQLAAKTRTIVEIELAANYQLSPDLENKIIGGRNDVAGRYVIEDECFAEAGWAPEANAKEVAKVVNLATKKAYKKTFDIDPAGELSKTDREDLNATLLTRRDSEEYALQLIRFEIMMDEQGNDQHPLSEEDVCKVLHGEEYLPDLPIVRFGLKDVDNEGILRSQIREFLLMLEKY